ncbi:hypothetical protein COY07_03085 [Candidatus Peregrinibacteria bacterium CG_4_10_14_0_2_um_filter_43_11]|nr:MAG: hypothetical protein COY07_03085 [Candidatus Peregrinibacteria bacterium CG_4_10_14_0_2_um_filter_43_11]
MTPPFVPPFSRPDPVPASPMMAEQLLRLQIRQAIRFHTSDKGRGGVVRRATEVHFSLYTSHPGAESLHFFRVDMETGEVFPVTGANLHFG